MDTYWEFFVDHVRLLLEADKIEQSKAEQWLAEVRKVLDELPPHHPLAQKPQGN